MDHYFLAALTALRDQLRARLSDAPVAGHEGPSTVNLVEKIKALTAAHVIEATPQRHSQRRLSAEEPVTTRIRRRLNELLDDHGSPIS